MPLLFYSYTNDFPLDSATGRGYNLSPYGVPVDLLVSISSFDSSVPVTSGGGGRCVRAATVTDFRQLLGGRQEMPNLRKLVFASLLAMAFLAFIAAPGWARTCMEPSRERLRIAVALPLPIRA